MVITWRDLIRCWWWTVTGGPERELVRRTRELLARPLVACLMLGAMGSVGHATTLLGVTADASYHEDSNTGVLAPLVDPLGGGSPAPALWGLATAPGGATSYSFDLGDWPNRTWLVTLNAGGGATQVAELTYNGASVVLAEGIAVDGAGRVHVSFCADHDFGYQSGHLGVVNPATGVIDPASVVALSGYYDVDADAIEFVGTALYMNDNIFGVGSSLYRVNQASGAVSLVGQVKRGATVYSVTDLAWDGSTLWAETYGAGGQLISINPITGRATAVGAVHVPFDGIAATPPACRGRFCR